MTSGAEKVQYDILKFWTKALQTWWRMRGTQWSSRSRMELDVHRTSKMSYYQGGAECEPALPLHSLCSLYWCKVWRKYNRAAHNVESECFVCCCDDVILPTVSSACFGILCMISFTTFIPFEPVILVLGFLSFGSNQTHVWDLCSRIYISAISIIGKQY